MRYERRGKRAKTRRRRRRTASALALRASSPSALFITKKEMALLLGVSIRTIEHAVRAKRDGFPKLYRTSPGRRGFRRDEALAYVNNLPSV